MPPETQENHRPPRDGLIRARSGLELRAADDGEMPVLVGDVVRWGEWAEIDSIFEGHFMERFLPGAFTKTIRESRSSMRVLFQHGHDPHAGDKPLGPIRELNETEKGTVYEVPLLDTAYNREILPGLEAGLYGTSFKFRVMREEFVEQPKRSDANPEKIPERTVAEAQLFEFGPVTFPAYEGSTAGTRSLTDRFIFEQFSRDPERLRELLEALPKREVAVSTAGEAGTEDETEDKGGAGAEPHPAIRSTPAFRLGKKEEPWRLP